MAYKKSKKIYLVSLFLSWPMYCILLILEKTKMRIVIFKLSALVVNFFGEEILSIRQEYDVIEKEQINKAILAIPSFGCTHYFRNGGCAMCGFNQEIEKYHLRSLHPLAIVVLVKFYIFFLARKIKLEGLTINTLAIFMAGSFLNKNELPIKAQDLVVAFFIAGNSQKLLIESRPEYITRNKIRLKEYVHRAGIKKIEIAIGLEASDDEIRNGKIKKRMSKKQYYRALAAIKEINALSNTYILIGAPSLSERQMVSQAVNSVLFAWQAGSDIVSIETYCVQEATPWAKLYQIGELKLPTLWAIIEVITRIDKVSSAWSLGEFSDWPQPIAVPQNCHKCTDKVLEILSQLRITNDMNVLQLLPACSCQREYSR